MPKLHLGVVDVPYGTSYAPASRRSNPSRPAGISTSRTTTGDVAQILEARYGVMDKFMDLHGQEVADAVAGAMQDRLEALLMGGPAPAPGQTLIPEGALGEVEQAFRDMLDRRELDGRVPGVPTQASLAGVNHRLKNPYARRGARPSFIDTGTYSSAMRAWVED